MMVIEVKIVTEVILKQLIPFIAPRKEEILSKRLKRRT